MNQGSINQVVDKVYSKFDKLPKKGKPSARNEWTTLATFLLKVEDDLDIASLATGTSCIGESKLDPNGYRVSDSHAEILARRAFQVYITRKISEAYTKGVDNSKLFCINTESGLLQLKPGIEVIFMSTQTPCGDCSIFPREDGDVHPQKRRKMMEKELSNTSQSSTPTPKTKVSSDSQGGISHEPDDIHRTGAKCVPGSTQDSLTDGSNYHVTGSLRIKPGRGDRTQSLSCSDKLSRWMILGCQGCLPMLLLSKPIYIDHVIVAGCPFNEEAMKRGLINRYEESSIPDSVFSQHVPLFWYSDKTFKYSKKHIEQENDGKKIIACFSSLIHISEPGDTLASEAAVDGYKLGVTKKSQGTVSSRLTVCRSQLFKQFSSCLKVVPDALLPESAEELCELSYYDLKSKSTQSNMWNNMLKTSKLYKLWPVKNKKFSLFYNDKLS